jgi:hypothetical protein
MQTCNASRQCLTELWDHGDHSAEANRHISLWSRRDASISVGFSYDGVISSFSRQWKRDNNQDAIATEQSYRLHVDIHNTYTDSPTNPSERSGIRWIGLGMGISSFREEKEIFEVNKPGSQANIPDLGVSGGLWKDGSTRAEIRKYCVRDIHESRAERIRDQIEGYNRIIEIFRQQLCPRGNQRMTSDENFSFTLDVAKIIQRQISFSRPEWVFRVVNCDVEMLLFVRPCGLNSFFVRNERSLLLWNSRQSKSPLSPLSMPILAFNQIIKWVLNWWSLIFLHPIEFGTCVRNIPRISRGWKSSFLGNSDRIRSSEMMNKLSKFDLSR